MSVVTGTAVTTIDIHIAPHRKDNSAVKVAYERTPLAPKRTNTCKNWPKLI